MTVRELQDRFALNKRILDSPNANTSSFAQRVTAEQAAVESRLIELQGMETINTGLRKTYLRGDDDMVIDLPPDPPTSRTLEAKRKALAQFAISTTVGATAKLGVEEAMELERAAFIRDKERQQRIEAKKQQRMGGNPANGQVLTREEREARIWAFMNYKPTESDLEEDDDDDDPANWFEDDQDDGRKGQDIIEPDEEDYSDIIRVDASRIRYSTFYEPRDED